MVDDAALNAWFCREILPLEGALTRFIKRNWRIEADVMELRQDVYERTLVAAREALPSNAGAFIFTVARNHLINRAVRARIVSFELVADLEQFDDAVDLRSTERLLSARDDLRRAHAGLTALPPRCREVVRLRKIEGLSTRETADRMGIGLDTVERQLTMGMRALVDYMLGGTGQIRRAKQGRLRRAERR